MSTVKASLLDLVSLWSTAPRTEMEAPLGGNPEADFRADEAQQERCICSGLLTSECSTLSSRIAWGCPRQLTTCSSTRMTRSAGSDGLDLNRQALSHAFIQHIEGPEASTAVERIAHEVHRPHGVRVRHHAQRLSQASGKPLLRPTGEIQAELTIHPPQPLMIPRMSIQSESPPALPKAPATFGCHQGREGRDHRRISPGPVHERPIVRRPPQPDGTTGPLNREAVYGHEMCDDLTTFSGR